MTLIHYIELSMAIIIYLFIIHLILKIFERIGSYIGFGEYFSKFVSHLKGKRKGR